LRNGHGFIPLTIILLRWSRWNNGIYCNQIKFQDGKLTYKSYKKTLDNKLYTNFLKYSQI